MKTIKLKLFLIMGLLGIFVLFTNCQKEEALVIQENNELLNKSVSAKGDQKSFVDGDVNFISNKVETNFVFHASVNDKHGVKGEWVERNSNLDTLSMGSIDCLMFYTETAAFARGTVVEWNKASPELTNIYFKLVDGEIDEFSGYVFVNDSNCESVFLPTSEIISGDLKVKFKGNTKDEEERRTHIPDGAFREALFEQYKVVADGEYVLTRDIEELEVLKFTQAGIFSLVGLEDFLQLISLDVRDNFISFVDFHTNMHLKELHISGNMLRSLDVSQNTDLQIFEYGHDVSCIQVNQMQLDYIYKGWNQNSPEKYFEIYSLELCN